MNTNRKKLNNFLSRAIEVLHYVHLLLFIIEKVNEYSTFY